MFARIALFMFGAAGLSMVAATPYAFPAPACFCWYSQWPTVPGCAWSVTVIDAPEDGECTDPACEPIANEGCSVHLALDFTPPAGCVPSLNIVDPNGDTTIPGTRVAFQKNIPCDSSITVSALCGTTVVGVYTLRCDRCFDW